MAIKIGNTDISAFKVGSGDCKVYLGDTLLYPTTPSFDGKWLATYSDSHTESAACDSTSAITQNEMESLGFVDIQLGQCVTNIGDFAFWSHPGLSGITIPNSVTSIGQYAFQNCRGLLNVIIPDSVTSIGEGVFSYCSGLTSCTIGTGVTSIGESAFRYCFGLTSITSLATTPPLLGIGVFTGTPITLGTGYIYVPSGSLNSYKQASGWSDFSSQILPIPNS